MKHILYIISLVSILFYSGCETSTSTGSNDKTIVNLGADEDNLTVLNKKDLDLKELLTEAVWKEMVIDLDKFYQTTISRVEQSYLIEMLFEKSKVTAYADCFKLTAKYKIDDKELSFSRTTYEPAMDLATCQQSKDADQAVYQLFSNTFEATKIDKDEIIFYSDEFETEIKLKR